MLGWDSGIGGVVCKGSQRTEEADDLALAGLGFRDQGLGFRVKGLGFRV